MITAVILTKNEEGDIEDCIKSLGFCDEVLVIDDSSSDKTREIAKRLGAKVIKRDLNMDFAAQNNFGMDVAQYKWVLFIDADERISKKLAEEILEALKNAESIKGYYFKRLDHIWGTTLKHGEAGSLRFLRLVRKGSGKWKRRVHQYFNIQGATAEFKNPILHYPHKSLKKFIESVNRWSTWHSQANFEEGKRATAIKIITYPFIHFVRNFLFKLGFLDGICGFVFAVLMSFHSFLAWSKLWILQKSYTKN